MRAREYSDTDHGRVQMGWRGGFSATFRALLYFRARLARRTAPQQLNGPTRFRGYCGGAVEYFLLTSSLFKFGLCILATLKLRSIFISLMLVPFNSGIQIFISRSNDTLVNGQTMLDTNSRLQPKHIRQRGPSFLPHICVPRLPPSHAFLAEPKRITSTKFPQ